jgi:hypothetical protein
MYYSACLILIATNSIACLQMFFTRPDSKRLVFEAVMLPAVILAIMPLLFFFAMAFAGSENLFTMPSPGGFLPLGLSVLGTVIVMGMLGWVAKVKGQSMGFMFMGRMVIAFVCCLLILIAAVKQLAFTSDPDKVGAINMHFLGKMVKDMECDAPMMLIRWDEEGGPVTYRCPKVIMLGFMNRPFAPWPDYTEGESYDIAKIMTDMNNNALNLEDLPIEQ